MVTNTPGTTETGIPICRRRCFGPSLTVPIRDGKLVLGTWQQIFHLECDIKPRRRTIAVTVMGDS